MAELVRAVVKTWSGDGGTIGTRQIRSVPITRDTPGINWGSLRVGAPLYVELELKAGEVRVKRAESAVETRAEQGRSAAHLLGSAQDARSAAIAFRKATPEYSAYARTVNSEKRVPTPRKDDPCSAEEWREKFGLWVDAIDQAPAAANAGAPAKRRRIACKPTEVRRDTDGKYYSREQFASVCGDSVAEAWDDAQEAQDKDGRYYTRRQFLDTYGGLKEWTAAAKRGPMFPSDPQEGGYGNIKWERTENAGNPLL
eukprot:TRINITY_DN7368_c0_g1_i1.p1 TRINITY_DN7368_c0_g1~~TRINITY_DN7368_c0_g1_i1.p1  ORF type:complete len:274 (+),score=69.99 TRINITY_DN7368_c0_g1_i1:59-823(+)